MARKQQLSFLPIFLVMVLTSTSAAPINTMSNSEAVSYLTRFNYMRTGRAKQDERGRLLGRMVQLPPTTDLQDAIRTFQRMWNLPVTGVLDEKTVKLMRTPRCGVPDIIIAESGLRKKRNANSDGWDKTALTYKITRYTQKLPRTTVDSEIEKAFKLWSDQTPLTFARTEGVADIEISFAEGEHGDGKPFDKLGGTLAHAFFPGQGSISGDTHFDNAEQWSVGTDTSSGTDLMYVAAHEFGHALGLKNHSFNIASVMYSNYKGYVANLQLHDEDISRIQAIYGSKQRSATTTTSTTTTTARTTTRTTTARPTTTTRAVTKTTVTSRPITIRPPLPDGCRQIKFDAITTMDDGNLYGFAGDKYYMLTSSGIAPGYPRYIASDFLGVPANIDAAVFFASSSPGDSSRTYLFKNNIFWRIENFVVRKVLLIKLGFPGIPDDISTAFTRAKNGDVYFMKGNEYYKYQRGRGVAPGFPRPLYTWSGLPPRVDNAFEWGNKNYFTYGSDTYGYNDLLERVDEEPTNFNQAWLECSTGVRSPSFPPSSFGTSFFSSSSRVSSRRGSRASGDSHLASAIDSSAPCQGR